MAPAVGARDGDRLMRPGVGQRMRADVCAALLHNPKLLFLDEPTIGLDVVAKERIRKFIQHINQAHNTTVLLTTHDMADVQRLCQRVAIIDEGQIIALDTPQALIRSLGGGILVLGLEDLEADSGLGQVQTVVDRIVELPSVKSTISDDGHLKVETHRFQEALMGILDITNQEDVRITSLEKWEPNLESVFLHLTGKKLRE